MLRIYARTSDEAREFRCHLQHDRLCLGERCSAWAWFTERLDSVAEGTGVCSLLARDNVSVVAKPDRTPRS